MAETDYNEILLEAIDAIVVSRISEVNFDRTIVATIVDASKAKDGEYVLSDGSVQFTVRNGSDKYKENDRVNVLIPSNDFSSTEKTILGKTSANVNDVPVTYVSPLEKIVPMETNYAAGLKGGITANSETERFQLTNVEWITVNESTLGYNTLCVSARFKTLLNDYDIRQGHYGLLVQLKTTNGYIHALTLDSAKDMFGNPYGYSMYLTQEQTYHLNLQDNIIGIKIDLYQMKDFKYNDGVNSELQVLPVMPYSNILVDNINVSFGYNAEQVEDNTVKISTADSLTYDNIKDASVTKKLTLTWYNKDENNKYLGFSDGHFAGQDKDNPLYEIKWYHSQNNGEWALLSDFNDAVIADIEINLRWAINEYKAIVTYDGNEYSSNILSFKAETGYDSNIHDQLNMELELRNGKDSLDSYPFYGADSAVINPGDASKNREIEFVYSGALGSKLESDVLNGAIVSFYIPTISTMLNLPFGSEDEELKKESDLEGYVLYQKEFSSYGEDNKQQLKTFRYRVKEFYNPLFNNNTVILKVIDKNGFEYSAKKTFSFSSYGTSGTDYTLVIEDPINKKATLYDADYKVIKTEFEDKDWSYWPSSIGTGTPTAAAGYAVRKLSTTVKWVGKTVTLEAIKGIPWYPENSNYYYQGPTTITYDSAGVNPRYYTGDIGLYDKSTSKLITGLTWVLRYYPKNELIKDPQTSISVQGYPQLLIDESGTKAPKLKAPNMYFDQDYYLVLVANNSNGQVQWRQPLIILQNAYLSNLLNSWNGALSVDQGNNTILSAMIGAGSKDSDNHFSGIVMGDLKKLDANGGILNSEHGLLGFHAGIQSFGFRTNGTAFIGKSSAGRIEFDGNSGTIKSAMYNGNTDYKSGSKWDLANGSIILNGSGGEYFKFNEKNDGKLEMKISGANIILEDNQTLNGSISAQISASAEAINLRVEGMAAGVNQLLVNTQGITGNAFVRDGSGFRFSLVNDAFKVGTVSDNKFAPVLTVNENGLKVTGEIEATKLIITPTVASGAGIATKSYVTDQGYLNSDSVKTVIGPDYITSNLIEVNAAKVKGTLEAANIVADRISAGTNKNAVEFTNITASGGNIGGISISPNGISSNGVSGGIVFEKRIQHTVSAGTNKNTIKISGWNNAAKWYNFYYKIISTDSDIVFSGMNTGTEYYIISSLPTGNADNISYTYKKIPGTSSHTIPKGSLSLNHYLLVNTPVLLNIVSSFKLGSDGILEATGVKLLGEIIANSGSIGGFTLTKYDFPEVSSYPAGSYDALMCKYYSYDDNAQGDNVTYTTYLTPRGVYTHYLEETGSSNGRWQFKSWYKIISS